MMRMVAFASTRLFAQMPDHDAAPQQNVRVPRFSEASRDQRKLIEVHIMLSGLPLYFAARQRVLLAERHMSALNKPEAAPALKASAPAAAPHFEAGEQRKAA